jgi:hypothetical protein
MKRLFALIILLSSSIALHAGEAEKQLIDRWYDALASINRSEITDLLSDKAMITLGDLDIIQTKKEFITSLDEWEDAMKGSTIRHAVESDEGGILSVLVCYKFPDNESLAREVFIFEAGKILESTQETMAESCDTFPG